ncbi:MAG: polyhydroxyalkanoic acid system family protein [Deltaproteobacteria bacterium]|nr:polyhydroxyalkanoic acid system family protein [Deltaproteobacteria bacterium]
MPLIQLQRLHRLPVAEVRGRLERAARNAQQRHRLSWHWQGNALEVMPPPGVARGARGRVVVGECDVRVEVDLPLVLRPARGMVETRLQRKLDDLLAAQPSQRTSP